MTSSVLSIYGLPVSYVNVEYKDTGLAKVKVESIPASISRAPNKGTLTIQGTAAPIVNQLLNDKRKVRGIDFITLSATAFEDHALPLADVVVLYNLGTEVSTNFKVSSQVFRKVVKNYSEKPTLLIIETDLTKMELLSRYDFRVTNFLKIPPKEEEIWI